MTITEQDIRRAQHWEDKYTDAKAAIETVSVYELMAGYAAHVTAERDAEIARLEADKKRLDTIAAEYWDIRCFNIPTGGDDADIGWRVIAHHMAEPRERVVGVVYRDDPRAAIDRAIKKEPNDE